MKIVAIVGSPRLDGNTNYLVDQALDEAKKRGIDTEKIILNRLRMGPCQAHEECTSAPSCLLKDDGDKVINSFVSADGIILASPVYFEDVSAQMKIFIDRNRFLRRHSMKPKAKSVGLIAVATSSGTDETIATFQRFLASVIDLSSDKVLSMAGYAKAAGQIKDNELAVNQARELGAKMAQQLLS